MTLRGTAIILGSATMIGGAVLAQPGTPRLVVDLRVDPQSSSPTGFITFRRAGSEVPGALFFATPNALHGNPQLTRSLVFHDGAGPMLVKAGLDTSATGLTDLGNGRAVFMMQTNATGTEPWVTDGTAAGTGMLRDVTPGSSGTGTGSPPFTVWDGKAYFADGWVTDGTTEGTLNFLAALPPITRFILMGGVPDPTGQSPGGWMLFRHVGALYRTNGGPAELVTQSIDPEFFPFGVIRGVPGQPDRIIFGSGLPSPASTWWLGISDGTAEGTRVLRSFEGNISTVRAGATGMQGNSIGESVYFFVRNFKIWKTDGTAAGTVLAGYQGFSTSAAQPGGPFVRVGSHVLYRADVNIYRVETGANSTRLTDFQADAPVGLVNVGSFAYFAHTDAATGLEPWITDGTAAGTRMLGDLYPGPGSSLDWNILYDSPITVLAGGRGGFISAQTLNTQNFEKSLFWLHPTNAELVPILSGPVNTGMDDVRADVALLEEPGEPVRALFRGKGVNGVEPWMVEFAASTAEPDVLIADAASVREVVDMAPGTLGTAPQHLGQAGRRVAFTDTRLGVSDGTAAGTGFLANPSWNPATSTGEAHRPRSVLGRYYFQTSAGNTGTELYGSDGTGAGTAVVADTVAGPSPGYGDWPIGSGGSVFFRQFASPQRLWRFEPETHNAFPVTAASVQAGFPVPVTNISAHADLNGVVCMLEGSARLLRLDSLDNSVSLIRSGMGVTADQYGPTFYRAGGLLYFFAQPVGSTTGLEVHVTDGAPGGAGTRLLKDINPGAGGSRLTGQGVSVPWMFAAVGSHAAFVATTTGATGNSRLWISDGTEEGTRALTLTGAAPAAVAGNLCAVGDRLAFSAIVGNRRRLWMSDLTDVGTFVVPDGSIAGAEVYSGAEPIAVDNRVFFSANAAFAGPDGSVVGTGFEPWVSDGTLEGTHPLGDLVPGLESSTPRRFTLVNSRVFFTATTPLTGEELWVIDLCPGDFDNSGTAELGDLFAYLTPWFARDATADLDGFAGVEVGDLFAFLDSWFAGCDR